MDLVRRMYETQETYGQLIRQNYFENVLFSFQWWFLLLITVLVWIIWVTLVDKKRLNIILLAGFIPSFMASIMDKIGLTTYLWSYSYHLLPSIEAYSINLAIIPVGYMLLYQYVSKWKKYLIVLAVLTAFAVLVAEPVFVFLDIYTMHAWKHLYSAPLYFLVGVVTKCLVDKLAGQKYSNK
ncbi:CBO0543 family protein [Virgibacillus ihumii]|uniref:CBO0543 family protein n=1 Tax=Virgibacillus ihumii TaxID=2686091 RepID=UPI00157DED5A|nr:CBO0543 family protein [Virgibacillus ihumii]